MRNALQQAGPYKDRVDQFSQEWVLEEMKNKALSLDWTKARQDVENFLREDQRRLVSGWSKDLFVEQIQKLQETVRL